MSRTVNGVETAYAFLIRTIESAGDDCIEWPYSRKNGGYGQLGVSKKHYPHFVRTPVQAHVVAWAMTNGRTPKKGMHIRHSCGNPACYNPNHLIEGTPQENADDRRDQGTAIPRETLATIRKLYFQQRTIKEISGTVGWKSANNYIKRGDHRCDDCVYQASRCSETRKRFDACETVQDAIDLIKVIREERRVKWNAIIKSEIARNRKMSLLRDAFFTLDYIGQYYGISRERVRQITSEDHIGYIPRNWSPIMQFGKSICKNTLANRLGVTNATVKSAFHKREFPAHWFLVVKNYADELNLECPSSFFKFLPVDSEILEPAQ